MRGKITPSGLAALLVLASGVCGAQATAPTPSFTIAAGNVAITSSGGAPIPFTLTSVNGFTGSVIVSCTPPNPPAGVREAICGGGPPSPLIALAANATATGTAYLNAIVAAPENQPGRRNLARSGAGASFALAGVLMLGFGLKTRRARWSGRLFVVVGLLIGLAGIIACASGPVTLTPGVYTYTLTASPSDQSSPTPSTSTTLQVTVPPGIDVEPGPAPI